MILQAFVKFFLAETGIGNINEDKSDGEKDGEQQAEANGKAYA